MMSKSMLIGTVFGITIATAGGAIAGYQIMNKNDAGSRVAQQNCYSVNVENAVEPKDGHRIAGSVVGGLLGGAVGKDVGDRNVTTAAGAAVGAIVGNQVQKKLQENRTTTTTETRCDPVR
jgi:uncharacterized protein YcfJ